MAEKRSPGRKGAEAFEGYYSELFGARWVDLRAALLTEPRYGSFQVENLAPYFLDEASLEAAREVNTMPGESVLDLCSAPGGKALVIAQGMRGLGTLVLNEKSQTRRARLKTVIGSHLPRPWQAPIQFLGRDGTHWRSFSETSFDRVLVDAPCSSERHVLQSPAHLSQWSKTRVKRLAEQQGRLVFSALQLLRTGGTALYCTCALNSEENDGVIQKVLLKNRFSLAVEKLQLSWGEPTKFGWEIFPDRCGGRGPIYLSKMIKEK